MLELTPKYLLSQFLVLIVYFLMSLTFFMKSRKKILWLNTSANLIFPFGLYLLGGNSGMWAILISNVRNIYSLVLVYQGKDKKTTKRDYFVLLLIVIALIVSAVLTYNGNIFSLFLTFATILFTYTIFQTNIAIYRWLNIVVSLLRLIYHIFVFSIVGIVFEIGLLIATVVGVWVGRGKL